MYLIAALTDWKWSVRACCTMTTLMACTFLALLCNAPQAAANSIVGTHDWHIVSRLTGPALTGQVGIGGTDLGHMVNHNGKVYYLFGDTFANDLPGGPDWRQNVMAYSTDFDPQDGIAFDGWITRPNGTARQVIVPGSQPTTYIPTGGISVGDKIYSWYMHVSDWSSGWTLSHAGLTSWREGDSQFTTVPGFRFQAPTGNVYSTANGAHGVGNFGMVSASYRSPLENANDDYIYIWGTPGGREGGVKLARVLPNNIENLSAYKFFDGQIDGAPQWTNNEFDAEKIISKGVGEMSVMYNNELRNWTMMYISGGANPDFEIRYADEPWGSWSNPITVTRFDQAPGLYSPYMNPLLVEDNGKTLYFTMSLWNPYDVYLAKVTLDIDYRTQWTGTVGQWSDEGNWSDGVPTEKYHTALNSGGRILVNNLASSRGLEIGTGPGKGGTIELVDAAELTIHEEDTRLGAAPGGVATLLMHDGTFNLIGSSNMLLVGDQGDGTAAIQNGSINASAICVANHPTATGRFTIDGDAVVTVSRGGFQMGRQRNVTTGAQSQAFLAVSGGTINVDPAGSLPSTRNFVVGWDGVAAVNMSGGTIHVTSNFVSAVSGSDDLAPAAHASIVHSGGTIQADAMTLAEAGVSDYTLSGTGRISIRGQLRLAWLAGSQSTFTQNGGTVEVALEDLAPDFVGLAIGAAGNATYTMNDGVLNVAGRLIVAEQNSSSAQLNIHGGMATVSDSLRIGSTGSVSLDGGVLTGAEIKNTEGGLFNFSGGTLTVDRFAGNLFNIGGDLAPGNTHLTSIAGNYSQQSAATLAIEIAGATSNAQYDSVSVAGTVDLGGQLQLEFVDDFIPTESDTLVILTTTGSMGGAFENAPSGHRLMSTDGSGSFMVFYGPESPYQQNQIVLTAFQAIDLPGDFNRDGIVDAADYAVWRDSLGAAISLPNETETLGFVTIEDYGVWKQHFGTALTTLTGIGSEGTTTVPEPSLLFLAACEFVVVLRFGPWRLPTARRLALRIQ